MVPSNTCKAFWPTPDTKIRNLLKGFPGLRSAYYLGIALRQLVTDQWRHPASFDAIFSERQDPWESTTSESERERFAATFGVLDEAGINNFATAVELGCAEGIFTERLAPRCDELLALDYSEVALSRARERLARHPRITFRRWDMRQEAIAGTFDLVVAMGVLTSLYRPGDVRRVSAKVVNAVKPGGFLLFSDVRQSTVFETAWWGSYVLRGGEQIRRHLSRNLDLETLSESDTKSHVFALFRRRQ